MKIGNLDRVTALRFLLATVFTFASCVCGYTQEDKPKTPPKPGPMLDQGTMELGTPDFNLVLVRSSQTIAALKPKSAPDFDFTPGDLLIARSQNNYFHLGDITI